MNGFADIVSGFSQAAVSALVAQADNLYVDVPPPTGTPIEGLIAGNSLATGKANSQTIKDAVVADADVYIPAGEWYTAETIFPKSGCTLTWESGAKLHQVVDAAINDSDRFVVWISNAPNVTLNNPCISQEGIIGDSVAQGTHACLAIFGDASVGSRIYGGVLEWGASNGFNGGEDDTYFEGTTFIDAQEHCVYVHGGSRDSETDPDTRPTGITFKDCFMTRPAVGTAEVEGNHVQMRSFHDVLLDGCTLSGKPGFTSSHYQYAILATGIDGLTIRDCTASDFTNGFLYSGNEYGFNMEGTNTVLRTETTPINNESLRIHRGTTSPTPVFTFTDCTFNRPLDVERADDTFDNCTFKPRVTMSTEETSECIYNDCTFDATDMTVSTMFTVADGTTATFTGDTTRVCGDGTVTNWGPIPGSCP